jgi:hypothetical protein
VSRELAFVTFCRIIDFDFKTEEASEANEMFPIS